MNNGISDVTSLSGDPGCTETLKDWADDMLFQLDSMSTDRMLKTLREMTDDERDMIREFLVKEGRAA